MELLKKLFSDATLIEFNENINIIINTKVFLKIILCSSRMFIPPSILSSIVDYLNVTFNNMNNNYEKLKQQIIDSFLLKRGKSLKDEDKQKFLEDFKKADISKKLDMWYFALEQVSIWDELIEQMAMIAQMKMGPMKTVED